MESKLTPLPGWFRKHGKKFFVVADIEALHCTNCGTDWFPRILRTGEVVLPGTCPNCRTAAYRKDRDG